MVVKTVKITNATGLHLKPAARFCEEALKFHSTITFTTGNVTANAKSVLSILGACVRHGDEIEIVCNGDDEQEAMDHLCKCIAEGLGDKNEAQ
ncbi:MAG: HPr family phosphocarrier protein [Lachnospiraceae bacterium]|jgi:phosphocarrier protein|nr:HPr family phosphocarrier protein [Lachnospiraceae bacterium]MCH4064388.1 HPr family phosphocarrier protein [Lachnospiraceae bacterium]MCH4102887.1 HPr family phosphocarrier protein [Lachnospiraceae bacterium]MCI1308876.1 HPr family phosphocarrier protein [Lachnospiraceae bacterium]MCI1333494.1 HPr family phosphocarrier protein [Lachnospiraceae bacterium]